MNLLIISYFDYFKDEIVSTLLLFSAKMKLIPDMYGKNNSYGVL